VVPNRGAAAHKGGPELSFYPGKGAAKFFFSLKGCREPKKVEKHCLIE